MKVIFESDDFSPVNHHLDLLEKLHEHYPQFKCTLFTVPWEVRFGLGLKNSSPVTLAKFSPFIEAVNKADWIEIALHGLTHAPSEFAELSYEAAVKRLVVGMKMFENVKIKNFTKVFKAPQWELSKEAKKAAESMGFKVVEDGYYNWNMAEDSPKPDSKEPYIMHTHIQNVCDNGLEETFHRIMKLPADTEFMFLSDFLGAKKGVYEYYGN